MALNAAATLGQRLFGRLSREVNGWHVGNRVKLIGVIAIVLQSSGNGHCGLIDKANPVTGARDSPQTFARDLHDDKQRRANADGREDLRL